MHEHVYNAANCSKCEALSFVTRLVDTLSRLFGVASAHKAFLLTGLNCGLNSLAAVVSSVVEI